MGAEETVAHRGARALRWRPGLAYLPMLVWAVGFLVAMVDAPAVSRGDHAVLELDLRAILAGRWVAGAYSQFGWHHPGPAALYFLAPLYGLFGRTSAAAHAAAALYHGAWLLGLCRMHQRAGHGPILTLGALLWTLAIARTFFHGLGDFWNPTLGLTPTVVCLSAAFAVRVDGPRWTWIAIVAQWVAVQCHVGYLAPTSAALAIAIVHRRTRREWLRDLGLLVALWAPLLIATRDNVLAIARYFTTPRDAGGPEVFVDRWLAEPIDPASLLPSALAWGAAAALVVAAAVVARKHRSVRPWLLLAIVQAIPVALAIPQLHPTRTLHASSWLVVSGAWLWLLLPAVIDAFRPAREWGVVAVVLVGLAVGARIAVADPSLLGSDQGDGKARRARLLGAVSQLRTEGCHAIDTDDDWGEMSALLLLADDIGLHLAIHSHWRFMFGDAVLYDDDTDAWLSADGTVRCRNFPSALPPLVLVESRGVRSPSRVIDGEVPMPGTRWDDPRAAAFEGPDAWVIVRHGGGVRLRVLADNNDTYEVEASADGARFEPVGTIEAVGDRGLQWRALPIPAELPLLRIRVGAGDGSYAIAEVVVDRP
ncbi:MAG: hypothetical protein KC619_25150 [Myxococcales bacterium]|nr:hypothetical protein [Myxococcales bacterium]